MGFQVRDSNRSILARMFNKIQLTVFTLLVFVCCVVIFPIHCDLSDFLLTPSFHCKHFTGMIVFTFIPSRSLRQFMIHFIYFNSCLQKKTKDHRSKMSTVETRG